MEIRQATIAELVLLGLALIIVIAFIAQKTYIQDQAQFIVPCSNTGIYTYDAGSRQCILSQVCVDNMPPNSYGTCDSCIQANAGALPVCAINGGTYFINFQTGPENNVYATCTTINASNTSNFNLTSPDSKVIANDPNSDGTLNGYGTNSSCYQSNTSSETPSFNFNQYNSDQNIGIKCDVQNGFSICDTSTDTDNTCIPLTNSSQQNHKLPRLAPGSPLYALDPMAYPDICQMYTVCDFQGTSTNGATGYYFSGQEPSGPGIYTFLGNNPSVCSNICFTETPNYYEYQLTSLSGIESNPQFKLPQPDTYISAEFNVPSSNCTGTNQSNALPNPICPSGMYFNSNSQNNNNSCCFSTGLNETCDGGYYVLDFNVSPGTPVSCAGPNSSPAYSTNGSQVAFNFENDCTNFVENYLKVPSGETRFNALNPTVGVTCNPTTSTQFCDLSTTTTPCTGYNGSFWVPSDVQADKTSFPCVLYTNCNDSTYPTQYSIGLPSGGGWVTGPSSNCPNNPPAPGSTKYVCIPDIQFNAFTNTTGFCRVANSGDTDLVDDCSMCAPTGTYCENTSSPTNSISCAYAYALNNPNFCDNTTNPAVPTCSTAQVCGVDSIYYNQDSLLPNYAACNYIAPKYVFTAQNSNCLTTTLNGETDPSSCCIINPELAPYLNNPNYTIPLMQPPTPAVCISTESAFNALTPCSSSGPSGTNCIYNSNPNWGSAYTYDDISNFLPNEYENICSKDAPTSTCLVSDFMQLCVQPIPGSSNYYIQPPSNTPFYNYIQGDSSALECAPGYTLTTINNSGPNSGQDLANYFYGTFNMQNLNFNCYPENCTIQQTNYSNNYLAQNICTAPNCS